MKGWAGSNHGLPWWAVDLESHDFVRRIDHAPDDICHVTQTARFCRSKKFSFIPYSISLNCAAADDNHTFSFHLLWTCMLTMLRFAGSNANIIIFLFFEESTFVYFNMVIIKKNPLVI